jgi:hypothetical protein
LVRGQQPDQGIEEIVPIALAGGEPPEPDALFVVQSIGQQFRILRDKPWPRDAITRGCRAPQTLKLIKAWPMATADETRKCEVNIEQGRAQEGCTVDIRMGGTRSLKASGNGCLRWARRIATSGNHSQGAAPARMRLSSPGYPWLVADRIFLHARSRRSPTQAGGCLATWLKCCA